uniref:uncharacterized protein LOC120347622 n=1 Tax=Styela clava TaxID=7725 RepID=UPI001939B942|nr:uncharacterized protein LOC120347622 [Styela clava]
MAKSLFIPPSTAEMLGFSKEITPWIGVNLGESYKYTDPSAGYSLSRVHTYIRQVRVVVIELRQKLDCINEEIKALLKFKKGLARSLDDLNAEIRTKTPEATVKRPRFIKNRDKEAEAELYTRGVVTVKFGKPDTKSVLHQLQNQYKVVKEQLQVLGNTRSILSKAIMDRVRILDLLPYVTSASIKAKHQEEDKCRSIAYAEKEATRAQVRKNILASRNKIAANTQSREDLRNCNVPENITKRSKIRKFPSTGQIPTSKRANRINGLMVRTKSTPVPVGLQPRPQRSNADLAVKYCNPQEVTLKCFCDASKRDICRPGICPGCNSCLPNALTKDCKVALRTASEIHGISRRTRSSVKDVVKECFTLEPFEDEKELSEYRISDPSNHRTNPYQAYYKKSSFASKSQTR